MILNYFRTFQVIPFRWVLKVFNEPFKKKTKLLNHNPVSQYLSETRSTAAAQIQSLALEFPYAASAAKKNPKQNKSMLNKINQTKKHKYYMILPTWKIYNREIHKDRK